MQGYCVKCKTKREIKGAKSITMKNEVVPKNWTGC